MKTIYAILAHDKKDSLNSHIFKKVTEHLNQKHNITINPLYLYDFALEIPFYTHDQANLENNPFFIRNKKFFLEADKLLIVHPVYWYSVPGILKCWIDLITNYAYKYENGFYAKALHKINSSIVISTSMAPAWYYKYLSCNTQIRQVKETLKFIGIKNNYFYQIGNVAKLNDKKVENHIKKINKLADKLILS